MVYTQGGTTVFERWDALETYVNHKADKLIESYMNEIRTISQNKKESNFEYAGRINMIVFRLQQAGHPGNKTKIREVFEKELFKKFLRGFGKSRVALTHSLKLHQITTFKQAYTHLQEIENEADQSSQQRGETETRSEKYIQRALRATTKPEFRYDTDSDDDDLNNDDESVTISKSKIEKLIAAGVQKALAAHPKGTDNYRTSSSRRDPDPLGIFVNGLPRNITESDLMKHFEPYRPTSARIFDTYREGQQE
ncbi:hypothetical protein HK101_002078 [Irineochytrium annulatum]|nr:hypothetical protein HK101_002078 [Irineochytrium annulatum]